MGGSDGDDNLVDLTASEHYIAHQILVKLYPDNKKLIIAVKCMCISKKGQIRNNKMYEWIKNLNSGPQSYEWKRKIGESNSKKRRTEEQKQNQREKMLGRKMGPPSEETLLKREQTRKLRNKKRTAEQNEANRLRQSDPEYRARQSQKVRDYWAKRKMNKGEK